MVSSHLATKPSCHQQIRHQEQNLALFYSEVPGTRYKIIMKKTFMNRNFLLTVTLSLLSYFNEMTADYETSLSLKCQSLHSQQQHFISFLKEQYFKD